MSNIVKAFSLSRILTETLCFNLETFNQETNSKIAIMKWPFRGRQYELAFYFGVYVAYLIYGLLVIVGARPKILALAGFEFAPGWTIWSIPRDDSNDELENFTAYIAKNFHWYLIHVAATTMIRRKAPKRQSLVHALVGFLALCETLRFASVVIFSILLLSCWTLCYRVHHQLSGKHHIWVVSAIWMFCIHYIKNNEYIYKALGYSDYFTLIQLMSWTVLRNCSYCLHVENCRLTLSVQLKYLRNRKKLQQFVMEIQPSMMDFYGYLLYFPCQVYGPFMGYQRYATIHKQTTDHFQSVIDNMYNLCKLCMSIIRVTFWWYALQGASHFMYLYYMARDVKAVQAIETIFGLHAIGYFMGQFFYLYYVITYGLGIAFAKYDGLNPPSAPRCVGRIHFYSDMWKYFDEGLYEFLFTHIYAELCDQHSTIIQKLYAIGVTFGFVFIWHGCHYFVLIWSVLNFLCLIVEKLFKHLVTSKFYKRVVRYKLRLSQDGVQRLNVLLATQIFIPSAFSNVFFISGADVGFYLVEGAYSNGIWNYILLTFCSYCFIQCAQSLL